jgi:Saxitoxin biosynthesis operon protein SxtJ
MKFDTVPQDGTEFKKFGLLMSVLVPAIFGVCVPYVTGGGSVAWPWVLGSSLFFVSLICPNFLAPVYLFWTKLGAVMGVINSYVVMIIVYITLFIPIAIFFRITRRDVMRIKNWQISTRNDVDLKTYKIYSEVSDDNTVGTFRRPF